MTISIVREKELGSMINFYVTPTRKMEYLLGKQLPYVVIGMINFFILAAICSLFLAFLLREVSGPDVVCAALRDGDNGYWDGYFDIHQQPGRGGLRYGD